MRRLSILAAAAALLLSFTAPTALAADPTVGPDDPKLEVELGPLVGAALQRRVHRVAVVRVNDREEVLQGAADEDAGGADAGGQRPAPVHHQHVQAAPGEQAGGVQAGQAGPDDENIHGPHVSRR